MNLRGSERLSFAAVVILIVLALAGHTRESLQTIPILALIGAGIPAFALLGPRARAWGVARDFLPVLVITGVFSMLEPIITGVNPARWDASFAAVDEQFFPAVVAGWRGFLGRPARFTDAIYIVYFSYYVFPVVVGAVVRFTRTAADYEELAFTVLLSFYLCYVGYFLWPTSGPRVSEGAEAMLGGGAVSQAIRTFLRAAEGNHLDAFPSGHTGVSLVTLALGWRLLPSWRPWLVVWTATIVFATVYIHVHYVIDVVAGTGAGLGVLVLATVALRREERGPARGSLAAP